MHSLLKRRQATPKHSVTYSTYVGNADPHVPILGPEYTIDRSYIHVRVRRYSLFFSFISDLRSYWAFNCKVSPYILVVQFIIGQNFRRNSYAYLASQRATFARVWPATVFKFVSQSLAEALSVAG